MNKTDRLLSILHELRATDWKRATDLADLFEVSTRTIYRDMHILEEEGIPVRAVPGKGYSLVADYFLPPLLFTTDEALMLLLGSTYLADNFDAAYRAAARSATMKLQTVMPESLQQHVVRLHESIRFVPVNAFDNPRTETHLRLLRQALIAQRTVSFTSNPNTEPQQVDPYGLLHQADEWVLIGWCHHHKRVQQYRVERLSDLTLTVHTFARPASYQHINGHTADTRAVTVQVLFDASVAEWVKENPLFYIEDMEQQKDGLLVTLQVRRETEVLPWLLSWGRHASVLTPASLRHRIAEEAQQIAARYQQHVATLF